MKIILFGAPGAGKGTQADIICKYLNIPKISTGDILRDHISRKTTLGLAAESLVSKGQLVDDATILGMIADRVFQKDCENGFLLDGFPRTVNQASGLIKSGINPDIVFILDVADEVIIRRLSGRRVHNPSGRTYHIEHNPPKNEGLDDITSEPLSIRNDDNPEVIKSRLKIYHDQTFPIIKFFEEKNAENSSNSKIEIVKINGVDAVENITRKLIDAIERFNCRK